MIQIGDLVFVPWDTKHPRLVQSVDITDPVYTCLEYTKTKWMITFYHPSKKTVSKCFMYEVVYKDKTIFVPNITIVACSTDLLL